MRTRFTLATATLRVRWVVKAWDPALHPRDQRGRFTRKPGGGTTRPAPRQRRRLAGHTVSTKTSAVVQRVRRELPQDADGWDREVADVYPRQRYIDRLVDMAERERDRTQADLAGADGEQADNLRWMLGKVDEKLARYRQIRDVQMAADPAGTAQYARMVGPERKPAYARDRHGTPTPPAAYQRWLDGVLAAGDAIHADYTAAVARDREHAALQARLDGEASYDNIRKAVADRDDTRRGQLMTLRSQLLREQKRRQQQIMAELVRSVRPFGGVTHRKARTPTKRDMGVAVPHPGAGKPLVRDDWQERLQAAEQWFPDDWLRRSAGTPLIVTVKERAQHKQLSDGSSVLAMPTPEADRDAYNGGFGDRTGETVMHEMGHRMEMTVPGLRALEFTYTRRRSTKDGEVEPVRQMREVRDGYPPSEVTLPDDWINPYAGKTYERTGASMAGGDGQHAIGPDPANTSWEVFQVGLQDTFGRSPANFGDVELQKFVLGVLATLG